MESFVISKDNIQEVRNKLDAFITGKWCYKESTFDTDKEFMGQITASEVEQDTKSMLEFAFHLGNKYGAYQLVACTDEIVIEDDSIIIHENNVLAKTFNKVFTNMISDLAHMECSIKPTKIIFGEYDKKLFSQFLRKSMMHKIRHNIQGWNCEIGHLYDNPELEQDYEVLNEMIDEILNKIEKSIQKLDDTPAIVEFDTYLAGINNSVKVIINWGTFLDKGLYDIAYDFGDNIVFDNIVNVFEYLQSVRNNK